MLCSLALLLTSTASAQTTALVGARVIDGVGGVIERGTIVVHDGMIVAVGPVESTTIPAAAERIDVRGSTIIPGLVNAHGHLTSAVGMRNDPNGGSRENQRRQLEAYAQYGVTTVFSLGDESDAALQLRREQDTGPFEGARLFAAGPIINSTTAAAARTMTDRVAAMGADVIKIRIDDNLGSTPKMPEEAWRAAIERARQLNVPVAVHIFYLADAKAALLAGATLIAHSVRDAPVDPDFVRELKARNACYSPTLMREVSTYVYGSTPSWARDPFFLRGAGSAAGDEVSDATRQAAIRAGAGYNAGLRYKEALDVARRNLKTLSDAGVRIAMGTDTGPAGRWQGFFEHLELEMMVESGMSPMQVLVAATSGAAECYGKGRQLGSIRAGAFADLLVLAANPLENIRNTRQIQSIWIAGRRIQ